MSGAMAGRKPITRLSAAAARFARARDGSVVVLFAVALIPMLLVALGALQYSLALGARAKLNAIADAAALQAVSNVAATTYVNSGATGATQAQNMFQAQAASLNGVTISSLNITVTNNASTSTAAASLTANVTYTASVASVMPSFLGNYFTVVSGSSTASSSLPAYSNFFLLIDDSPSMGIGATAADITAMQNANNGCAFACHSPDATSGSYPGYQVPNVPGTQLRIDAMRTAVTTLIQTAISSQSVSNHYKIGLYTFDNAVHTISALTTSLSQVQTAANNIQLPTTDLGTQIGDAVNWLSANVVTAASGTGTQPSPFEYVFLVTDGVEDHAFNFTSGGGYDMLVSPVGSWYGTPYSSVMMSGACTGLKNKGVTVAVLYLNYDPLSDSRYTSMVQPFASNIVSTLQACASPNFFFQADDASSINTAMQQMFAAALQKSAHLSK